MNRNPKLLFIFACTLFLHTDSAYSDMSGAYKGFTENSSNHTSLFNIHTYTTQVAYTQGGLTINYPTLLSNGNPLFVTTPFVTIGIEHLNLAYATDIIASTTVVANSTTSITIRINKIVGTSPPVEADTNDFLITIFAVERAE